MVEAHVKMAGSGEVRLLAPVLRAAGKRKVVFVQPPHAPNALALAAMGLDPSLVVWVNPDRTADAMWACEQILKSAGAHVVLFWQNQVRTENLRRLNLAAGANNGAFFMFRPLACAQDPSPAPLRIALTPAIGGILVEFVKRRGPVSENGLLIPLSPSFVHRHAPVDRPVPTPAPARSVRPELVE
jgi:protein ImuA